MKRSYACACGAFSIKRGKSRRNANRQPTYTLSRREYAAKKREHARSCELLANELAQSQHATTPP